MERIDSSNARVSLRRAEPSDATSILAWRQEPSAARHQPFQPTSEAQIAIQLAREAALPLDGSFSGTARFIVETAAGPIGWIMLREVNREHRSGEIGYTIGEAHRGQGLATAAVQALLAVSFNEADLERLGAAAAVQNAASRRVLERVGFVFEGIARAYLIVGEERVDHARYSLLRREWLAEPTHSHDLKEQL